MPLALLHDMWARSVRQNPRTERAGLPWSAVCGQLPRFVKFGLREEGFREDLKQILGLIVNKAA